ncbi:hypothetical protein CLOM_g18472 [Closterium sp. NIES-68]|nr:hypothetical protein CLOM_g18472 [Closterium sp. NIES-68]GJP69522.1 hypothetical protein CLOP_g526 [Closterium sp. NIES-67]
MVNRKASLAGHLQPMLKDFHDMRMRVLIPTYPCPYEERVGAWGMGGKWVCLIPTAIQDKPVVYSVGSDEEYSFEEAMFRKYHSLPYTLDPFLSPQAQARMQQLPFLHFHSVGLAGRASLADYQKWNPNVTFRTLPALMKNFNHAYIDILKLSCSGCEEEVIFDAYEDTADGTAGDDMHGGTEGSFHGGTDEGGRHMQEGGMDQGGGKAGEEGGAAVGAGAGAGGVSEGVGRGMREDSIGRFRVLAEAAAQEAAQTDAQAQEGAEGAEAQAQAAAPSVGSVEGSAGATAGSEAAATDTEAAGAGASASASAIASASGGVRNYQGGREEAADPSVGAQLTIKGGRLPFGQLVVDFHEADEPQELLSLVYSLETVGYRMFHIEDNPLCDLCITGSFIHDSLVRPREQVECDQLPRG